MMPAFADLLAPKMKAVVPDRGGAPDQPAPVGVDRQHDPARLPDGAGEMHGAVVDRDDEIHRRDLRSEGIEELRGIDFAVPIHVVPCLAPQRFDVATNVTVLQGDEGTVRGLEDRAPEIEVDGTDRGAIAIT